MSGFNIPILHNCNNYINIGFTLILIFQFSSNILMCISNNFKFKSTTTLEDRIAIFVDIIFLTMITNIVLLILAKDITFSVHLLENIILALLVFSTIDGIFSFKLKYNFKNFLDLSKVEYKNFMYKLKLERRRGFILLLISVVIYRIQIEINNYTFSFLTNIIVFLLIFVVKMNYSKFINSIKKLNTTTLGNNEI